MVRGEGWAACAAAVEEKLDTAASIALPYKTSTRPGGSTYHSMYSKYSNNQSIHSTYSKHRKNSKYSHSMVIVSIVITSTRAAAPDIVCVP